MAKYEYTGDGTVEIEGLGTLSRGDTVDVPDSFDLGARPDFKAGSGSGDVRQVEAPPVQPSQEPVEAPAAPATATPARVSAGQSTATSASTDATPTTPQGA